MKFTPGPWEAATHNADGEPCEAVVFAGGRGNPTWIADCNKGGSIETCAANARLIAACPDLLEACVHAADILQGGDKLSACEPWAQELIAALRAAIARATND